MRLVPVLVVVALANLRCGAVPCGPTTCVDGGAQGGGAGGATGGLDSGVDADDAGTDDAGATDAGQSIDSGVSDAGVDAGATDAGQSIDSGVSDAGVDAGATDAGQSVDSGVSDAGVDGGATDAGQRVDSGVSDAGLDAGAADAGFCASCTAPQNGTSACGDQPVCDFVCNAGYAKCFRDGVGLCSPITADDSCGPSCERCGETIGGTSTCDGTRCVLVCRPGYHLCRNTCVPDDSVVQCGASCTVCPAPAPGSNEVATCTQGVCGTQCLTTCNGACVDFRTDESNCGGCGVVCQSGTTCLEGQCTGVCRYELEWPRGLPVPNPLSFQVGDVDGDRRADAIFGGMVALSRFDGGAPSFVLRPEASIGLPLAVADFTRDGRDDIVASSNTALLLLVASPAGFAAPTVLSTTVGPVVAGDFDERNGPDLALAGSSTLTVHTNDGTGAFAVGYTGSFGATILRVHAGDLNGDGHADLVLVLSRSPLRVEALIGNGQGGFTPGGGMDLRNPSGLPMVTWVSDQTGDDRDELVVERPSVFRAEAYRYDPPGQWWTSSTTAARGERGQATDGGAFWCSRLIQCGDFETYSSGVGFDEWPAVRLADVTGDGLEDVIAVSVDGGLAAVERRGDALVVAGPIWHLPYTANAVTDINADGRLDYAWFGQWALAAADGGVGPFRALTDGGADATNALDLDGDAFGDLAVVPRDTPEALLFRGGPTGVTPAGRIPLFARGRYPFRGNSLLTEDIDGDGALDVLVSGGQTFYWARAVGSGVYAPLSEFALAETLHFGDFNNDGRRDRVRTNSAYGSTSLTVELNAGGGLFVQSFTVGLPWGAFVLAVRDLNGDGNLDLDLAEPAAIRYGNGRGAFAAPVAVPAGIHVDLDRDGRFDTIDELGRVTLSATGRTSSYLFHISSWNDGVTDFNHDGVLDLWSTWGLQVPGVCR